MAGASFIFCYASSKYSSHPLSRAAVSAECGWDRNALLQPLSPPRGIASGQTGRAGQKFALAPRLVRALRLSHRVFLRDLQARGCDLFFGWRDGFYRAISAALDARTICRDHLRLGNDIRQSDIEPADALWGLGVRRGGRHQQNTKQAAIRAGVPPKKIAVIYLGIDPPSIPESQRRALKARFEAEHGIRFGRDKILLNFGRQVPRKGMAQFLERGLPMLDPHIKLIVSGTGPDSARIRRIWEENDLRDRVFLLYLSDEELGMIRKEADLFIMPNVPVPNDVEGFGIAQLECMHDGTPAVVFAVDALPESVRKGGYLIPPNDYAAFADQIHAFFQLSPEERAQIEREARDYVRSEFTWDETAAKYVDLFVKG